MAKLFIICGHGAGDPGCCAGGYTEAERVRALGQRIKELGGPRSSWAIRPATGTPTAGLTA